ncbi:MAG: hypothetical protein ABI378_06580 [Chitinophagaceae bacterium]
MLGYYTSSISPRFNVISPTDSDIVWNVNLKRWEVTIEVAGTGGFFAYGDGSATSIIGINSSKGAVSV